MTAVAFRGPLLAIRERPALSVLTATLLLAFIASPAASLARDWWVDPEANHGLLLVPIAFWLAWRSRAALVLRPAPWLGSALLVVAVLSRYAAELAAELYVGRMAMLLTLASLTVFYGGFALLRSWWLSFALLALSIPLPAVITGQISLPLQLEASRLGAALLDMRHVPVQLAGNVIRLPHTDLFVAEACSGLRSLTALLSVGVLAAGLWLHHPLSRMLLMTVAVPIAVAVNAVRVFVTGYAIYFFGPEAGEGVLHATEGWLLFVGSLAILFALATAGRRVELWILSRRAARP